MSLQDDTSAVRQASFGWMIQRLAGDLDRKMTDRLAPLNIGLPGFAVMMCILENAPMMQTDISKHYGMPAYKISRALDTLEKLGYVERAAHASSRRAHSIQATEDGRAIAPLLHNIVRDVNAELTAGLSEADKEVFRAILHRLLPQNRQA